jgi:hypothetical protein
VNIMRFKNTSSKKRLHLEFTEATNSEQVNHLFDLVGDVNSQFIISRQIKNSQFKNTQVIT